MLRTSTLLAVSSLALLACSESRAPEATPVQPVRVITAGADSNSVRIVATGLVGSQEEARLGFKTGGVIRSITVDAGARVRQGQILATLDNTEIDAQVRQATESLAKARRDRDRADKLFSLGVIAEQTAQDARTQLALAEAALSSARFNRQHATITAPGNGIVLQRLAEPRELAAPGAPILVVSRDDRGWVLRVGLDDKAATRVSIGDTADIRLNAYPTRVITSTVREIGGASDPRTGTVTAKLGLPVTADLHYISGQTGEAAIMPRAAGTRQITVPLGAVLEGHQDKATLYVVGQDNKAAQRRVTVGRIQDDRVEILTGLQPGERVVSEGAAWLNAGTPVRVLP